MADAEKAWASGAIVDALSGTDEFKRARTVFVFLGTDGEPDTTELVGLALGMEKSVSVPRVKGDVMEAVAITPYSDFKRNKWRILEPVGGRVVNECELCVLPLVAFDTLKRLGHGKGYYDRFLASSDCFKIGIAFDVQEIKGFESQKTDVPLDMLITEKRIIYPSGRRGVNPYGFHPDAETQAADNVSVNI